MTIADLIAELKKAEHAKPQAQAMFDQCRAWLAPLRDAGIEVFDGEDMVEVRSASRQIRFRLTTDRGHWLVEVSGSRGEAQIVGTQQLALLVSAKGTRRLDEQAFVELLAGHLL